MQNLKKTNSELYYDDIHDVIFSIISSVCLDIPPDSGSNGFSNFEDTPACNESRGDRLLERINKIIKKRYSVELNNSQFVAFLEKPSIFNVRARGIVERAWLDKNIKKQILMSWLRHKKSSESLEKRTAKAMIGNATFKKCLLELGWIKKIII